MAAAGRYWTLLCIVLMWMAMPACLSAPLNARPFQSVGDDRPEGISEWQYSPPRLPPKKDQIFEHSLNYQSAGSLNEEAIESIDMIKNISDDPPQCSKGSSGSRREKRFVPHLTKWQHRDIRWTFRDPFNVFTNISDFNIAKDTVAHAFSMWSLATKQSLRFHDVSTKHTSDQVDIDVFFAVGDHGDHEPFDGRGGIVAHSGYPPEGKVHFDASELWMINGDAGIDLRYVVLHETGHALGLRHSKHKDAIMYPIYRSDKPAGIALSDDDIKGISYLYPAENVGEGSRVEENGRKGHGTLDKKVSSVDFEELN